MICIFSSLSSHMKSCTADRSWESHLCMTSLNLIVSLLQEVLREILIGSLCGIDKLGLTKQCGDRTRLEFHSD